MLCEWSHRKGLVLGGTWLLSLLVDLPSVFSRGRDRASSLIQLLVEEKKLLFIGLFSRMSSRDRHSELTIPIDGPETDGILLSASQSRRWASFSRTI